MVTSTDEELSAGRLGRTVGGRWRLESVLGVGGMAAVYAARDPSGSVCAIKILHPEMSIRREVREGRLRISKRAGRYYLLGAWLLEWLEAGEVTPRQKAIAANGTIGAH